MPGFPPETELNPFVVLGWGKFDLGSRNPRTNEKFGIFSMAKFSPEIRISGKFEPEFPPRGSEKERKPLIAP